jgi:AraC family transcriptional regulator
MNYIHLIQIAIDYMEEHLSSPITLKSIARYVHVSPFHFHRTFRLITGESVASYLRKRRFSLASIELLETNERIIDIAMRSGFGSHESFTRSFKQVTGVNPDLYRVRGIASFQFSKLPLTENELFSGYTYDSVPQVSIQALAAFQVSGLLLKNLLISDSPSMENNQRRIEELWGSIQPSVENYDEQVGVIIPTGGLRYNYLAGVRNYADHPSPLPVNWEISNIPKQLYAIVSHHGTLAEIPNLYKYILGDWISNIAYTLTFAPELELYRFDSEGRITIEICIPIEKEQFLEKRSKKYQTP